MFLRDKNLPVADSYFVDAHGQHVWRSYYEYIRDHLGYRLELTRAEMPDQVQCGQPFDVTVELVNCGFASPVNPRPVYLVLRQGEAKYAFAFDTDIQRSWSWNISEIVSGCDLAGSACWRLYGLGFPTALTSCVMTTIMPFAALYRLPRWRNWLGMEVVAQK